MSIAPIGLIYKHICKKTSFYKILHSKLKKEQEQKQVFFHNHIWILARIDDRFSPCCAIHQKFFGVKIGETKLPDKYNKRHLKLPIIKEKVVFEEMTARCIHFTHKNAYYNTQTRTLSVTITEKLTLGPLEKKISS